MYINYSAVLFSIGIILLKRFSPKICQFIQILINRTESTELKNLRIELDKLKLERDSYNMIDEFAKYARVDRKVTKLNEEIQTHTNQSRTGRFKYSMYIKGINSAVIVLLSIAFIWSNYDKPVVEFLTHSTEELNIFFPFNSFLSFPCKNLTNSLGVTFWLFILNRIIDIAYNKFNRNDSNKVKLN